MNSVEFEPPNLEINEEMYLEQMPVIEEATDSKGTYEKQPTSPLPNEVSMTEPLYDEQNRSEDLIQQTPPYQAFRFKETKFEDVSSSNTIDKLGMLAPPDDFEEMDFLNQEIMRNSSINDRLTPKADVKSCLNSNDT